MGRKKKVQTPEPASGTITTEGTQSIGYQGTIEVSIKHGNRTIVNKKYHNNGLEPLFRFLANCLGGNITESLRPTKLRLFIYEDAEKSENPTTDDTVIKPSEFTWTSDHVTKLTSISPFITYNTTPFLQKEGESYTVTLHFSIPFAYITDNKVYAMGLYPNNITNNIDASAYFLYTELTQDKQLIWKPLDLTTASGDFTFVISWKLSISNK